MGFEDRIGVPANHSEDEMSDTENIQSFNQSNDGYTNAGVIQLRLDTGPMLDNIEAFLRGQRIHHYDYSGKGAMPVMASIGRPKMNDEGVQSIMSWLTPLFSPHTVQGNFATREELEDYLCRLEKSLGAYLWKNRREWETKIEEVDGIIDMIMNTAEPFFTRLLQNKERESYSNTMQTVERSQTSSNGGLLGIFGGRNHG